MLKATYQGGAVSECMCVCGGRGGGACLQRPDRILPGPGQTQAQGVAQRSPSAEVGGRGSGRAKWQGGFDPPLWAGGLPDYPSTRFICFLGPSQARPLTWIQRRFAGWVCANSLPAQPPSLRPLLRPEVPTEISGLPPLPMRR